MKYIGVKLDRIPYGPVKVLDSDGRWWIGYYDDDINDRGKTYAYVYRGNIDIDSGYYCIPENELEVVNAQDLYERKNRITRDLFVENKKKRISYKKKCDLLVEYNYIQEILIDMHINAKYLSATNSTKIFISHSSKDKKFVRMLATDLGNKGYDVWFDEWNINVGDSIPHEIANGLKECDYLVLVLSNNSINSNWVENEWQSIFWEEIEKGEIKLLPLLKEQCEIPILLKQKKYADFSSSYSNGLLDLMKAIK